MDSTKFVIVVPSVAIREGVYINFTNNNRNILIAYLIMSLLIILDMIHLNLTKSEVLPHLILLK